MILRNTTQVFTWKSEPVRVKRGCKFWPRRPCLRAIFFQGKGTSYRPMPIRAKRSCLVVLKCYKKKFGKSRISAGEIPKLLPQDYRLPHLHWASPVFYLLSSTHCRKLNWKIIMLYFDHFLRHITSSYHVNSILAEGKRHQTGTWACLGLTTSIIDVVSREPKKASCFWKYP